MATMTDSRHRGERRVAFGNSVHTLLDIYSNCLSLLKAFERRDGSGKSQQEKHQAQLRKSLKEDRARVRRAYSSAVSERGRPFEHGDNRSRSALSRILSKLKAAITNLLRTPSNHKQPTVDYESLMLLSNASRAETIKAFEQLSRRLGSTVSLASSKSSSKRSKPKSLSSSTTRSQTSSNSTMKKDRSHPPKSPQTREKLVQSERTRNKLDEEIRPQHRPKTRVKIEETRTQARQLTPTKELRTPTRMSNRLSFASIATDSTKLGEIPERKWTSRRLMTGSSSSESSTHYNVQPVYPLRPYEAPVKERTFTGWFRRRT